MDRTRGTLFFSILEVVRHRRPAYVLLENVGNFERHDAGKTWRVVRDSLRSLGYFVYGTEHLSTGGPGLISPHHLGYPHHRERFFAVASLSPLVDTPFPARKAQETSLSHVVLSRSELTPAEVRETRLTPRQRAVIELWGEFLQMVPSSLELPSFPLWLDELGASYPSSGRGPHAWSTDSLRRFTRSRSATLSRADLIERLPPYVRRVDVFPGWKTRFIEQNRIWWRSVRPFLSSAWIERMQDFPHSLRKFEWNVKHGERNIWKHVLQFRPSGLRVKRYDSVPALVSMTTTQIPILGPQRRFISRREGLRLLGLPDSLQLPETHASAFRALGNAVHVDVVRHIASRLGLSRS